MAAFNKKENSGGRRGRSERPAGKGKPGEEKKDGYKSKRSFTKNKSFRDIKLTKEETGGERKSFRSRPFERSDKPGFKKREGGSGFGRDSKPRGDRDKEGSGFKSRPDRDSDKGERSKSFDRSEKPSFRKREGSDRPERSSRDKDGAGFRPRSDRDSDSRDKPSFRKREGSDRPERSSRDKDGAGFRPRSDRDSDSRDKPSFRKREGSDRPERGDAPERKGRGEREGSGFKPRADRDAAPRDRERSSRGSFDKREKSSRDERPPRRDDRAESRSRDKDDADKGAKRVKFDEFQDGKAFSKDKIREKKAAPTKKNDDGLIRLNKYLSNAGIASRRDADQLILGGTVKVNGVVVDQLGYKINPGDKVTYGDSAVKSERKVYLLLNKPKDYITTMEDPRDRKTVMELIEGACRERIYPVGRLDRNTTGLLLFTNDGELTTKLTHPKFGVKKVYHATLNKGLKPEDFTKIVEGIELEDGVVKADDLAFVGEGKKEVGIEIHSGKNRVVRRIFEHLGYDVLKLDRVVFAGLTKKDLPRSKHRFLTAKEISFLQMIG